MNVSGQSLSDLFWKKEAKDFQLAGNKEDFFSDKNFFKKT